MKTNTLALPFKEQEELQLFYKSILDTLQLLNQVETAPEIKQYCIYWQLRILEALEERN